MDSNFTRLAWRGMLALSIIVVPFCLLAGPAGWLMLVLWVAAISSVIPDEGERALRVNPALIEKRKVQEARSRADRLAQQHYLDHRFGN